MAKVRAIRREGCGAARGSESAGVEASQDLDGALAHGGQVAEVAHPGERAGHAVVA